MKFITKKVCCMVCATITLTGLNALNAQQDQAVPAIVEMQPPVVVNFQQMADYELTHPIKKKRRFIEQGEDREKNGTFAPQPVPANAVSFNIQTASKGGGVATTLSAAPVVSFNGTLDNGTIIPPDIRGAAGPNHIMETTNQDFKIYTKTGSLVSTVSIPTLFSGSGGTGFFDPHIVYDNNNSRWIICVAGDISANSHSALFLAISQTNNPQGSWFLYSVDATGNTSDFMDYPLLGLNNNWIVVTGRNFKSTGPVTPTIFVWNRATTYAGTATSASVFTDATNGITLAPAQTYDNAQSTEYLVCNWNGNSGGSGYVRLSSITGTAASPVYSSGSVIGVANPWYDNGNLSVGATQSGTSTKIESGDSRIANALFINGSLWFSHTAYLPATSSTRSAIDWWQINPVGPVVQQFGRIDSAVTGNFNFYSGIAVNAAGDALIGYCHSSANSFASAAYSFHAATDAAGTSQSMYVYKNGMASYNKTFGSGRNRFGDYTMSAVDPVNNSFWNFSEWAQTGNNWGTVIANVASSGSASLSSIATTAISQLTYCAGAVVSVPFTTNGNANAGNVFTAQLSNSSGSFAAPAAIGTLTSTTAGSISAIIPVSVTTGTGYRIRVVSSNPVITGTDNGSNISISAQVAAAGPISGFTTVCAGIGFISYSVPAIANATTYNWTLPPNATIQSGAGTNTITVAFSLSSTSGNIIVSGVNGICTGASSTLAVTVNPAPAIPTAGNVSGCAGSAIALSGSPSGGTFSVPNPYTGSGTTYTYTVTNGFGCSSTSAAAAITVNALPSCLITGNGATCAGSGTQWCAPPGLTSYLWSTGSSTQCTAITNAGIYTVTATNASGCTSSCNKTLIVNPAPACSITGSSSVCPGSSTLWCAPAGMTSYSWSNGITTQCFNVSITGNYTVNVTDANGCNSACSKSFITGLPLTPVITGNTNICQFGGTAVLNAGAGYMLYNWSTGATTQSISVNSPGAYIVTVTDMSGCTGSTSADVIQVLNPMPFITGNTFFCPGSTTLLDAGSGFTSYLWSTGASTQTLLVNASGNFTVTVTDANGCSGNTSQIVSALPNPIANITGNTSFCAGSTTTLASAGVWSAYNWSTGDSTQSIIVSTSNTYTLTVTDASGCTGSAAVTTSVNPLPAVSFTGLAGSYNITALPAILSGTPPGGTFSGPGISGITFTPSAAGVGGPYTITYSYTDGAGCSDSSSQQTTVTNCTIPNTPGAITSIGGAAKMCPGDVKSYKIAVVAGATSYTWVAPAGAIIAAGQGTKQVTVNYNAGFIASDTLHVTAINACGSSAQKTLKINRNTPAQPSVITGLNAGVCNLAGVPYAVASVAGITYNWGNSNTNAAVGSGQGTSAITADFNAAYTTGSISVTANNGCGASTPRALTVKAVPATPPAVTGAINVCANQFGVPYSIAPVSNVINYTWAGPAGSHINDGSVTSGGATLVTTATNVTVNYGINSGTLKVRANNACGNGTYKSLTVAFNCREAISSSSFDVTMFPNPAEEELNVSFNSTDQSSYSIKMNDIIGNTLLVKKGVSENGDNSFKLPLKDISPGVYLVEIKNGDMSKVLKLVVN